jgi:IgGFc binding protein
MRRTLTPLFVVCVLASCGNNKGFNDGGTDGSLSDVNEDYDFVLPGDGGDADAAPCTVCSSDLHSILACGSNEVLQTCTGTTGCGPGGCIDACMAAAASKSSIGCDYYSIPPDAWTHGSCFAAFVANNWTSDMKVSLVWNGATMDATPFSYIPQGGGGSITYQAVPSTGIPAGSMAIVFLNQVASSDGFYVACPTGVKVAITSQDVASKQTSKGNALELQTSVPATVYDIYPYGGALSFMPSATLLLPTTAWDTNFVATTMSEEPSTGESGQVPGIDFVAQQDGTQITLLPTTNITALNGVAGATANSPVTYTLNKGEQLRLMQAIDGSGNDLTGSIVQSNFPIGVWGEHFCMTHSADPPTWRVVGAVNGTTLTYDPAVPGAPATLKEGQLVEFAGPGVFHVKAQDNMHPFYLAAHRPGGDCDAAHQQIPPIKALGTEYVAVGNETTNEIGGPETVNVVPPAQFLTSYTFFTDPTYGYTDLALVRVKASDNTFKDVTLDCITGPITGWMPAGTGGQYEYVHVDVQTGGAAVGKCTNGLHTISSAGQIGITVWGYDSAASYAYPAGASVQPINTVVVPPTPH